MENKQFRIFAALPDREMNEFDQLREWIKNSVNTPRSTQIHNLANGVLFCRLMSKIFPGSLASIVIINRPANDGQFKHNYMLLQAAFAKVHIPWPFDTNKLIACDNKELLRLAKTLSHFHDAYNNLLQRQSKRKTLKRAAKNAAHRAPRCRAGDVDMAQHMPDLQPTSGISVDDQLEAMQQALEKLSNKPEPPKSTTVDVKLQLKEQIQTLFNSQQLAIAAFMANQQQQQEEKEGQLLQPNNATSTCVASRVDTVMCLCSNCVSKRNQMSNSSPNY